MASVEGEEIGSPEVFQTFSGTTGIETTAMDATNGCVCVWLWLLCYAVLCVVCVTLQSCV